MRLDSLIDYTGYVIAKAAGLFFRLIPVSLGLWLGRRVGQLAYFVHRKRRTIAYRNLKAAFASEMSRDDIKRVVKKMYQNFGQTLVEVLTLPRINRKYIDKFMTVEGLKNLEEARRRGKGIIFLTGHFGNWELSSVTGAVNGYPMLVLAREQKHSRLNDLLNSYRELTGCRVISKGFALRDMLHALRNNSIIGMLVDQDAGKRGVFVDFFGRRTSTAHGPMSFALKTGATILPAFTVRQKGPYHKVIIEKPIEVEKTQDVEADIKKGLQIFARVLESRIRSYPEQWLWVHKRWKSTPTRRILILNDGRAGHLNQSIAVAEMVQKYRNEKGYQIPETSYQIVDVHFKKGFLRNFLNVSSIFSDKCCQGCLWCLKFCLTESSYGSLIKTYADIIISCGASTEGVNLLLSKELDAKNILIMKPSMAGISRFSLVIAPKHDKLKKSANAVITDGAPTRITEERLKEDGSLLAERFKFEKKNKIGVFIGGDNPEFRLSSQIINEVIEQVIELACQIDAEILVTTSRRTAGETEQILKKRLGNHMRCKLLVIANEANVSEAVTGILGLCRVVVVSCESVSMISEASSAFNHTFVFELEKKKEGLLKHELFLKNLAEGGYIKLVKATELCRVIKKAWDENPPIKRLDDSSRIYEAAKKIL